VDQSEDYVATHIGKKYPLPPPSTVYKPLKTGCDAPPDVEMTINKMYQYTVK
jgi:hypothetical protein